MSPRYRMTDITPAMLKERASASEAMRIKLALQRALGGEIDATTHAGIIDLLLPWGAIEVRSRNQYRDVGLRLSVYRVLYPGQNAVAYLIGSESSSKVKPIGAGNIRRALWLSGIMSWCHDGDATLSDCCEVLSGRRDGVGGHTFPDMPTVGKPSKYLVVALGDLGRLRTICNRLVNTIDEQLERAERFVVTDPAKYFAALASVEDTRGALSKLAAIIEECNLSISIAGRFVMECIDMDAAPDCTLTMGTLKQALGAWHSAHSELVGKRTTRDLLVFVVIYLLATGATKPRFKPHRYSHLRLRPEAV